MSKNIMNIIKSSNLTMEQKIISLAKEAENTIEVLNYSNEAKDFINKGIICELFEGNAPYRPRYILPDYELFMKQGSNFLELDAPSNIYEAINNLLIMYKHVPSITSFPVYIGSIDKLIEPYINDITEARQLIKLFLIHIDKTITDSFCHANIGPEETTAGKLILEVMAELQLPTPNLTFLYDKDVTPQSFLEKAIKTSLVTAKPSYANHKMFASELGNYGIASCYNGLKIAGGGYTLVRMKLGTLASYAKDVDDFFNNWLEKAVNLQLEIMDKRINFIVEESNFFNSNFLVKENLIKLENFTGMFGLVGLAECVNSLMGLTGQNKYGYNQEANDFGVKIIERIKKLVDNHNGRYCEALDNKYLLHAQVGIDTDLNESPGCRIPIGEEPDILTQLNHCTYFHKYFTSGIGDIFVFDQSYKDHPESIVDIINGAFGENVRYISLYEENSDVVRVTGYLAKRSEIEKLNKGEAVLRDTTVLAKGAKDNGAALDRRVQKN